MGMMLLTTANPTPIIKNALVIPVAHAEVVEQVIDTVEAPKIKPEDTLKGNCYLWVKYKLPTLPRTKDIVPNSIYPNVGGVTLISYNGVMHYMYNEEVTEEGIRVSECNFTPNTCGQRLLTWKYLEEKKAEYYRLENSP